MWYIKCTYKDKSANKHQLNQLLVASRTYTLGRSSSNDIVIHKPSVSAIQLQFKIDTADYPYVSPVLKLKPVGKSTTVNGEVHDLSKLSNEERISAEYMTFTKNCSVVLGTSGITVKFIHKFVLLKLGKGVPIDEEALKRIGVIYNATLSPHTTHLISNNTDTLASLAALIQQIPIVSLDFVKTLIKKTDDLLENFTENFPDVTEFLIDQAYLPNAARGKIFENIIFIFGNQYQHDHFKPILEQAASQAILYRFNNSSTPSEVQKFVESHISGDMKPVLVKIQSLEEAFLTSVVEDAQGPEAQSLRIMADAAKLLSLYVITNEEIFTAVKELNIAPLLRHRPKVEERAPLKRKRGRVQQLDSLDFFAGGGKYETPKESTPEPAIAEGQQLEASPETQEPPKKKKKRSRIQSLDNAMLNSVFKSPVERETPLPMQEPEAIGQVSGLPIVEEESNGEPELQIQSSQLALAPDQSGHSSEAQVLATQKPKPSFTSTLLLAKEEANTRIKSKLGLDSQLGEDPVESLTDLAVVEAVEISLREPRQVTRAKNTWDPKWEKRKNYKVFVKSSKGKGDHLFLQTRNFVNFIEFDPATDEKIEKKEREMIEELEAKKASFSFKNPDREVSRQPTMLSNVPDQNSHQPLFIETDDDSDGEGFKFSRDGGIHNDDGLGMNVTPAQNELQMVPEFRRIVDREPSEAAKQLDALDNITNAKALTPLVESDDDDDDDDDDDVPRFRFRS